MTDERVGNKEIIILGKQHNRQFVISVTVGYLDVVWMCSDIY